MAQQWGREFRVNSLHAQKPDYFPMHIGDKWIYEHRAGGWYGEHCGSRVIEVTDTTTIARKTYFVFGSRLYDLCYEPGRVYHTTHYYRETTNGDVMKFNTLVNQEQLYYTLQKDSLHRPYLFCDEFDFRFKWRVALIDTQAVVRIPSGVFTNCYVYSFGQLFNGRNSFTRFIALAPGIGFIEETVEGDFNFITGAYINGQLMGDTTVTAVQETEQSEIPRHPMLYQNYPNPFNSATRIAYSVPDLWSEATQVSIFDISGREIITFTPTDLTKGHHQILWNGVNKSGKEVSGGICTARLKSGRYSQNIKLNYLR